MNSRASEYQLSKFGYYADFFTVPAANSIAVAWVFSEYPVSLKVFAAAIMVGFTGWTFLEYAFHRWGFHGAPRRTRLEHALHHIRPADYIGASSGVTGMIGGISFFVLTFIFGPQIGTGLLVGLVAGYIAYIYVHDRMHHAASFRAGSYLAFLHSNHEFHHRRFKVNYGVTSPLWDYVFGTYVRNQTKMENERA